MAEALRPHHVALCALLRLYLHKDTLAGRLTAEMYEHVGTIILREIKDSTSISLPSLPELLIDLEVRRSRSVAAIVVLALSVES
jgi:hypothetical protein